MRPVPPSTPACSTVTGLAMLPLTARRPAAMRVGPW
ncbi:Uncharacterised protein [Bordetella pertussis]|nr:Uncharacterised protein [Bordetella pertussis]